MKKIVCAAAFLCLQVTEAISSTLTAPIETTITDDGFRPIDKEKLPHAIYTTLKKSFGGYQISAAAVAVNRETDESIYQVTLTKEETEEIFVLLKDTGEVIK